MEETKKRVYSCFRNGCAKPSLTWYGPLEPSFIIISGLALYSGLLSPSTTSLGNTKILPWPRTGIYLVSSRCWSSVCREQKPVGENLSDCTHLQTCLEHLMEPPSSVWFIPSASKPECTDWLLWITLKDTIITVSWVNSNIPRRLLLVSSHSKYSNRSHEICSESLLTAWGLSF